MAQDVQRGSGTASSVTPWPPWPGWLDNYFWFASAEAQNELERERASAVHETTRFKAHRYTSDVRGRTNYASMRDLRRIITSAPMAPSSSGNAPGSGIGAGPVGRFSVIV